jgi:hypothetical protein
MLTFFDFISTIHGCSSIRHGVALLGQSFSRLERVSRIRVVFKTSKYVPALDEVLEILCPLDTILGFVFQLGNGLPNNVGEQVN